MKEDQEKKGGEENKSSSPKHNDEAYEYKDLLASVKLLEIPEKQYIKMYNLDISKYIEKRGHGSFTASYLSWAHAARLLYSNFRGLHADIEKDEGGNVLKTIHIIEGEPTYYINAFITNGFNRTPSVFFPIMDKMFKPVRCPNARDISDSIQRAKVKAIAEFTGIGLICYAGEDVPDNKNIEATKIVNEADRVEPIKEYSTPYPETPDKDKIFLSVPYPEKDQAKEAGARWDKGNKKWYATADTLADCMKWTDKASDVEQRLEEGGIAEAESQPHGGISPKAQSKAEQIAEDLIKESENKPTDPDLNEDVPF